MVVIGLIRTGDCILSAYGIDLIPYAAMKSGEKNEDITPGEVQFATIRSACALVNPVEATTSEGHVTLIMIFAVPSP